MNHTVDWVRTLGELFVVLAMIVAAGWLLCRLQQRAGVGSAGLGRRRNQAIIVVTQRMLGAREKVVVVDVEGTWLVLGVTQQHIQMFHTLPRPAEAASAPDDPSGDGISGSDRPPHFADVLSIQLKCHLTGKLE